ncbi:MAG: ATP-dependent zinc metalloprotease FtsH [Candidatus Cloacimonetes bacterium]|nr:ATP-dependent zinc metalloprotease FtsH [Candidatus Cloacimonadota bacterium]
MANKENKNNKKDKKPGKNKFPFNQPQGKSFLVWLIIILAIIVFFQVYSGGMGTQSVSYSQFREDLKAKKISQITFSGKEIEYQTPQGKKQTNIPFDNPQLVDKIAEDYPNVKIESEQPSFFSTILQYWLPFIIFIAFWFFIMKSMRGGAGKVFDFGKSKAKQFREEKTNTTFKDVAGVDEAKEELEEIIEFLKAPDKFKKLGGRIPKGVVLMGPPGTGKTLLAKAVAGEAGVPFFSISGSNFVEMFVGVGASRVRDLFEQGKKNAPCIIFIDELDAVGRHRGAGLGGGHDEREQTLNQLLVEMDGFDPNESVILIAATNRPDILDPALLRPGRFDRQVTVDRPDMRGRLGILKVHTRDIEVADDVDLKIIAKGTPGFSGADLENLVNEAALWGARLGHEEVTMNDFENAKDKVIMGKERRSLVLSDEEKKNLAYHEAGHALVSKFIPESDPVHKVTIIPRGRSLGSTHYLPLDDRHTYSKSYCEAKLAHMMGGRVADEVATDKKTTGAGEDLKQATDLARKMVCDWGMSEKVGPRTIHDQNDNVFLGKKLASNPDMSSELKNMVDEEIKAILEKAYKKDKKILLENRELLDELADMLLEQETVTGDELNDLYQEYMEKKEEGEDEEESKA